jgi:hypothetical protein
MPFQEIMEGQHGQDVVAYGPTPWRHMFDIDEIGCELRYIEDVDEMVRGEVEHMKLSWDRKREVEDSV